MSVDKFGRYSGLGVQVGENRKRSGLPQTPEGDYDISNKRLKFVKDPEEDTDGANLKTVKEATSTSLKLDKNTYNVNSHRLINIGKPTDDADAITKKYLSSELSNTLKLQWGNNLKDGQTYDAGNHRITNVANPRDGKDSVNKEYLHSIIPEKTQHGYSFYKFIINDIGYPKEDGDAVNLKYIKDNCILHDAGIIDCNGNTLSNVKFGSQPTDAVTMEQMSKALKKETSNFVKQEDAVLKRGDTFIHGKEKFNLLEEKNKVWDGKAKRLTNLNHAKDEHDAVILSQVPKLSPTGVFFICRNRRLTQVISGKDDNDCVVMKQTITLNNTNDTFNAKNKRISNILPGEDENDAASIGQVITIAKNDPSAYTCNNKRIINLPYPKSMNEPVTLEFFLRLLFHVLHDVENSNYEINNYIYHKIVHYLVAKQTKVFDQSDWDLTEFKKFSK